MSRSAYRCEVFVCGRYNIETDPRAWLDAFEVLRDLLPRDEWQPRYNVAPSQQVPVIRAAGDHWELVHMLWGFVPGFVKDGAPKIQPINARDDKLQSSGYYRQSFQHRRCLLPASGFYEWQKTDGGKVPHNIQLSGREPLLLGGIWDTWRDTDTVAVITTAPNKIVRRLHNRMPLIVRSDQASEWLEGDHPTDLLTPFSGELEAYPVSRKVNSPANDGPELVEPKHNDSGDLLH